GNTVQSLAFQPNGNRLISSSFDGTLNAWSLDGESTPIDLGPTPGVSSLAFSPDGQWLAVASTDGRIVIRDARSLRPRMEFRVLGAARLAFAPDNRTLAAVFWGRAEAKLWDIRDGTELHSLKLKNNSSEGVAFDSEGGRLAIGGWAAPSKKI